MPARENVGRWCSILRRAGGGTKRASGQTWRAGPFRSSSPSGEPQIRGVSEAMSAIRVLRTRRENTVQQRDATLPGRRPGSRSWAKMDIKEAWAAAGPELARPATPRSPRPRFWASRVASSWLCLLFIYPRAPNLINPPVCQHHAGMISSLVPALISAFKARRELALENVALRQQLAVLRRSVKRPRLSKVDREFWVLLRRIWTDWESVLVLVKPETVIRWHRCGFRRYWTWEEPTA